MCELRVCIMSGWWTGLMYWGWAAIWLTCSTGAEWWRTLTYRGGTNTVTSWKSRWTIRRRHGMNVKKQKKKNEKDNKKKQHMKRTKEEKELKMVLDETSHRPLNWTHCLCSVRSVRSRWVWTFSRSEWQVASSCSAPVSVPAHSGPWSPLLVTHREHMFTPQSGSVVQQRVGLLL